MAWQMPRARLAMEAVATVVGGRVEMDMLTACQVTQKMMSQTALAMMRQMGQEAAVAAARLSGTRTLEKKEPRDLSKESRAF